MLSMLYLQLKSYNLKGEILSWLIGKSNPTSSIHSTMSDDTYSCFLACHSLLHAVLFCLLCHQLALHVLQLVVLREQHMLQSESMHNVY